MPSIFVNQLFVPGDQEGFAAWRGPHYYEHVQFNLLARGLPNPAPIPEYDIYAWDDDPARISLWHSGHYEMHQKLRDISGITGVDLSKVDWRNPLEVYSWLENHSAEHALLEQFFGIE